VTESEERQALLAATFGLLDPYEVHATEASSSAFGCSTLVLMPVHPLILHMTDLPKDVSFKIWNGSNGKMLVRGSVGDTFEAALPLVKMLYDAVREGR